MRYFKLNFLLFIILSNISLYSIPPIVNVPKLPKNLRNFITDEAKYFEVVLDYYIRAKLLEAQLGVDTIVPPLSYSAIQNQDLKEIRTYSDIANTLYDRVKNLPEIQRIAKLQYNLGKVLDENQKLKLENDSLKLLSVEANLYRRLISLHDSIITELSKILSETEEENLTQINNILRQKRYPPTLAFEVKATQWFFENSRVNTYIAPSFGLEFHLFSLANDILSFKFSPNYTFITNLIETPYDDFQLLRQTYKNDIWNFSSIFAVNLSKVIDSKSFHWEIDLTGGYFLGFTKSPSPFGFQNDFKGYSLGIQTVFSAFNRRIPISVVLGGAFSKFIDELKFEGLSLGKPFIPNVFLGLKFSVLNSF